MTYQDIYNKFMIEYDKANVSSSYPSFTEYEICTFLDKAYLAVIAQKVGHSPSQSMLIEQDPKSIHELSHLYTICEVGDISRFEDRRLARNAFFLGGLGQSFNYDALYIINAKCDIWMQQSPDEKQVIYSGNIKPVSIETAQKSFETSSNYPRLKQPLLIATEYAADGGEAAFIIVLDPTLADVIYDNNLNQGLCFNASFQYIKHPDSFNEHLNSNFLVPDKLASEIISTAVIIALENIESPRVQTKAQLKQLEA